MGFIYLDFEIAIILYYRVFICYYVSKHYFFVSNLQPESSEGNVFDYELARSFTNDQVALSDLHDGCVRTDRSSTKGKNCSIKKGKL